ncbi:uncharacterized protein LOC111333135 [Stylophora pistillata]|uniref:uncharacterized protein LOC111333135 n=1 Tax=Stylophora pistillata TaxID=50429 RepID=UPI000C041295|nr:uncharacterized protein LOC111333135 [Stylophora pistillata]XP_022794389.1 uncharacterized protein LOC111333135 [Stylophora pistillata]
MFVTAKMLFSLFLKLQVIMDFLGVIQANVITECRNENNCIKNYSDVYNSLRSEENYYNIALALYPSREPSSVVVRINLYSTNQSDPHTGRDSPVQYTWCMSCLYAAIPANVLELLSLGAILISSRTKDLDITIAPFCCNVSKDKRIVNIDRVLSELQDLADSPKIENPTLNTVECVTEGHTPDIASVTAKRKTYIRAMLWSSLSFAFFFGPLLALGSFIFRFMDENDDTQAKGNRLELAQAVRCTIFLLAFVEFGLILTVVGFAIDSAAPCEIYIILGVIFVEALIIMPMVAKKRWFKVLPENKKCEKVVVFMWGNLTAFHFSWLVVGIMINTLWGFTVLLVISVVISAFVFAIYIFLCSTKAACEQTARIAGRKAGRKTARKAARKAAGADKLRFGFICFSSLLSVMSLVVVVILSGQAFFGRESANELMKTALLYVTTAFISWIARKVKEEGDKTKKSGAGGAEKNDERQDLVEPNTNELTEIN